jgi:hypothetical protein
MSNGLRLPKEEAWLANITRSFIEAIKSQWHEDMDEQVARARSDWLLKQVDIRQWSPAYVMEGHPDGDEIRYRSQLLSLAMINSPAPRAAKVKYWQWFDDALLHQVRDEQRELYDAVVQQVRAVIDDAAKHSENEGVDAG